MSHRELQLINGSSPALPKSVHMGKIYVKVCIRERDFLECSSELHFPVCGMSQADALTARGFARLLRHLKRGRGGRGWVDSTDVCQTF